MKKIYSTLLFIAALGLSSCNDDILVKTPLSAPVITEGSKTVSTLSFNWTSVDGASQYAYELYDANNTLISNYGGVTTATSVVMAGLDYNTTYTLRVWAYSPIDGNHTTSPIASITATTNSPQTLGTPEGAESTVKDSIATVTWPEVENATGYHYVLTKDGETLKDDTVDDNRLTLSPLTEGDYTLTLIAISSDENFSDSEPFTINFTVEEMKQVLWQVNGTYHSTGLDQDFDATLVAYNDGSYTLKAPFGVKGYNFNFTVAEGGTEIVPQDVYTDDYGYSYIYTSSEYYLAAYMSSGYSYFSGTKAKGKLYFANFLYKTDGTQVSDWVNDTFQWEFSIADLYGTYNAKMDGYDWFNYTSWTLIDRTDEVTISKGETEGTVTINNFYDYGYDFIGTVDLTAGTITIEPTEWGYFTFADATDETKAVVGTINADNTISFSNFGAWYSNSNYIYQGMTCEMSKKE